METSFSIEATYQNSAGRSYRRLYTVDLSEYRNRTQLGEPPMYRIANNIKKMQPDMRTIAAELKRLRKLAEERS